MEEIELIDYLRVIYKRKWLIVILALVAIIVVGVVSLRMPKVYHAEAIISIGKVFDKTTLTPVSTPEEVMESLLFRYGSNSLNIDGREEGYSLKAELVRGTSFVKITVEGSDIVGAKDALKRVTDKVTEEHFEKTKVSIQPYEARLTRLEADVERIQKWVISAEKKLEKANPDKDYLFLLIMAQNYILQREDELRKIREDILFYRSLTDNLERYKTSLIGKIKTNKSPVRPKIKRNLLLAGAVGLMLSIFLAFFVEYVEKAKIGG